MKRKRKEHLVGVGIRKFMGEKKSRILKGTLKVPGMKSYGRTMIEKVMQGMAEYAAEQAQDRPKFGAKFLATWRAAVDSVRASAERMLAEPNFVAVDRDGGNPYDLFSLTFFARLMDNLTYEEEEAFRDILVRLDGAWGMYFSVVRMRWPKLSPLVDRAEEIRAALQLEVQRLFFGEVAPALTPCWRLASQGLERALELIGKEATHDLA